ncbi:MAG: carboxylesterase family protein [Sinobacteraceae bacterium]|nr:carboxylesterase family protein [Nevskiaceae bacterium]MCP5359958.1 carboxylesterase family protein [Nevskiaceae bacterium]MCP5472223.1 carboxylesterase family protein [Nevskiaceae bacterium]
MKMMTSNARVLASVAALLFVPCVSVSSAQDRPEVKTTLGIARGITENGVHVFKGLPYAAPPTGELRWARTQAPRAWSGVRDASRFGNVCPQPVRPGYNEADFAGREMSEDCLTLNVWTTALRPAKPRAVMVWILPGGFVSGDGGMAGYNGQALARQDVVTVTFNYRLGYLGQFAHPALSATEPGNAIGNFYLSDQVAALHWVKDNIAAFGGDPDNVTIFGMSAGGVSVNYLLGLPASKGLFQKAISESSALMPTRSKHISQSSATTGRSLEADGAAMAQDLGAAAGGDDPKAALAALRALPWKTILEYQSKHASGSLNPVIDGQYLPEPLGRIFSEGRQHAVPYMTGATSWEGSLLVSFFSKADPLLEVYGMSRDDVRELYGDVDERSVINGLQFDTFFGSQRWLARQHLKIGQPTYLYRFDYVYEAERGTIAGARHGEETPYVFKTLGKRVPVQPSAQDWAMSDIVSGYWVAFAKTGNPNGGQRPEWPRQSQDRDVLLNFAADGITAKDDFEKKRMMFFDAKYSSGQL